MAKDDAPRPDFSRGIAITAVEDGRMLAGRVGEEDAVLARVGEEFFAVGAHCTHYHGRLADGLIVGDTIRCPLHHACFNLRTGDAMRAPALDPISRWRVDRRGDMLFVTEKLPAPSPASAGATSPAPASVVIIGGGGAGLAAADMLRREGYDGPITMFSADDAPPPDRPNLSKEYLAGEAKEDWIPLREPDYYLQNRIDLQLKSRVTAIDTARREVALENGDRRGFGALLIATGADPVRLSIPGADTARVFYLRTFADSNAIVAAARPDSRVVVIGASFIGLEVSAALRTRGLHVEVVAPEHLPLERVLGQELGQFVRGLHEAKGVVFHLGETVTGIDGRKVTLSGGGTIDADFVVVGVGVRPVVDLAEKAGLAIDRGITVNEFLETSIPGIFAAGDAARWRDPRSGERRRVEHWVVAERMGQTAARNILGRREPFDTVPFFWSRHYNVSINYVGHAEKWEEVVIDGDLAARRCTVSFKQDGRTLAVATIGRNRESLRAEAAMEQGG
jgi:NADPH-dependent 2,4-dienoyl-CoA reductase/sulfur reductase-like enzyme/nitrite reductase/ring-hydroxylating ferredoxin subunit